MSKINLGILGGGQLGSMLATAAKKLNVQTFIYCDDENAPAQKFADDFILGDYSDENKISEFVNKVNVVTTGKEGAFCVLNQEVIKVDAIANIPIIDTTGAGDLFAAGFINSYNNGLSIERSLQKGCELAAKIIQQFGARLEKS